MAHGVAHQVLQGAVQVTQLAIHQHWLGRRWSAAQQPNGRTQRRLFAEHLIEQGVEVDALKLQRRLALLQARIGEHFVHQAVEFLDITVHTVHVLAPGLVGLCIADHLQTKPQARHRRAQLMGHRPHHLALDGQQVLQLPSHVVERRGQTPH